MNATLCSFVLSVKITVGADETQNTENINMGSLRRLWRARRPSVVRLCLFASFFCVALTIWNHQTEDGIMISLQSNQATVRILPRNENSAASETHAEPVTSYQKSEIRRKDGGTCEMKTGATSFSVCPQCFRPNIQLVEEVTHIVNTSSFVVSKEHQYVFKPRNKIQQNLVTKYKIMPSGKFLDDCPYLLAVQASIADSKYERNVIRNTWASVAKNKSWPFRQVNADVKILFVLAEKNITKDNANASEKIWKEILEEAAEHDDILYLDMIDSYRNLTLKLLSAFKWVTDYCPCAQFVLKVDQDTFVNVPLLVDTLLYFEKRFNFSIVGRIFGAVGPNTPVSRTGRWSVAKELYPLRRFPHDASGCGYIISMNALTELVKIAPYMAMFNIEDAFITGVLRMAVGCKIFNVGRHMFTHYHDWTWDSCCMYTDQKILGSRVPSARHYQLWNLYLNGGKGCNSSCSVDKIGY